VGELSRKERDDNRPFFDASKGAKLIDDWKRLEKSFPEAVRKIRELAPARVEGEAEDLLVLVAGDATAHVQASDTKTQGHLSEREIGVYSAAGNLRVELARRYADRHKGVRHHRPGGRVTGAAPGPAVAGDRPSAPSG
jgi:aspartyl-tRNA synthetase